MSCALLKLQMTTYPGMVQQLRSNSSHISEKSEEEKKQYMTKRYDTKPYIGTRKVEKQRKENEKKKRNSLHRCEGP